MSKDLANGGRTGGTPARRPRRVEGPPAVRGVPRRIVGSARRPPDTLDLKIAASAIAEMRDAFAMFAPYKDVRKVSIFGSARTTKEDPLYEQARGRARAGRGGLDGRHRRRAGDHGGGHARRRARERSIGVSIRLPFETGANFVIAGDPKHVSMKYFFTRKLMLVKESSAFVCLPGGFGTLDETFELLTLTQTGKGVPVPIVFLDTPGDEYWEAVDEFVENHLVARGLVAASTVRCTASPTTTRSRSARSSASTPTTQRALHRRRARDPHAPRPDRRPARRPQRALRQPRRRRRDPARRAVRIERRQNDHVELDRIAFEFAHHGYRRLRALIDAINSFSTRRWPSIRAQHGDCLLDRARAFVSSPSSSGATSLPRAAPASRSKAISSSSSTIASSRSARSSAARSITSSTAQRPADLIERLGEEVDRMADLDARRWRCMLQPGLALTTTVAPDARRRARRRRPCGRGSRRRARAAAPSRRRPHRSTDPRRRARPRRRRARPPSAPAGAPSGRGAGGTGPARSPAAERRRSRRAGRDAARSTRGRRTRGPRTPRLVGAEQVAVVLQRRAASGRVDEDRGVTRHRRHHAQRQPTPRRGVRRGCAAHHSTLPTRDGVGHAEGASSTSPCCGACRAAMRPSRIR